MAGLPSWICLILSQFSCINLLISWNLFFLEFLFFLCCVCNSLRIFCSTSLVVMNNFGLCLPCKVFISPIIVKDNFIWNNKFGWQLFSFEVQNISFHTFLALQFMLRGEAILLCLSFCIKWCFFLMLLMSFLYSLVLAFYYKVILIGFFSGHVYLGF
jgi:hypothetical protein